MRTWEFAAALMGLAMPGAPAPDTLICQAPDLAGQADGMILSQDGFRRIRMHVVIEPHGPGTPTLLIVGHDATDRLVQWRIDGRAPPGVTGVWDVFGAAISDSSGAAQPPTAHAEGAGDALIGTELDIVATNAADGTLRLEVAAGGGALHAAAILHTDALAARLVMLGCLGGTYRITGLRVE